MAVIPHPWEAYGRLQERLAKTTNVKAAASMEAALNIVHRADFRPEECTQDVLKRGVDTAGRRERDQVRLLHRHAAAAPSELAPEDTDDASLRLQQQSLGDELDASRELVRLRSMMPAADWELLTGVAVGASYQELAFELATSPGALRSRVCRLRQTIVEARAQAS